MKETIIGIVAGVLTSTSAIPQLVKTFKERKADEISTVMFLVLCIGTSLWAYYGVLREDWPIIITNAFSSLISITMLILKFKFRGKGKS
ncbi:MAG: hypothetical protein K0S09_2600 [Sphingobacteriaceae bacterium]|jgi:MtN3 and saliva related transmembrane protein|nr:hypothetical protein [Sphingobacteriaceae bacterium]